MEPKRLCPATGLITGAICILGGFAPALAQPQLSPVLLNERFDTYVVNPFTTCTDYVFVADQAGFEAAWPREGNVNSWQVQNLCASGTRGFSTPVSMRQTKSESHRNVRDLTPAIQSQFPGFNAVNGTLENPLQFEVYIDADNLINDAQRQNVVIELTGLNAYGLGDMAPNSDVIVDTGLVTPCGAEVCTQTPPNPRNSIAIGIFADLDPPAGAECPTCVNPRQTQHIALYDGERWWLLRSGFPVGSDPVEVKVSTRRNRLRVTIYADTITVYSNSSNFGEITKANIPRKYTGAFNRVAIGNLVPAAPATGVEPGTIDDLYVSGGVGANLDTTQRGACCVGAACHELQTQAECSALSGTWSLGEACSEVACAGACCFGNGQCAVVGESVCLAGGGTYAGGNTTCEDPGYQCCPTPGADSDGDGDVDMDDFGAFQACFTGPNPADLTGKCGCFDKADTPPGVIDNADFLKFLDCATRPNVPWEPSANCPS